MCRNSMNEWPRYVKSSREIRKIWREYKHGLCRNTCKSWWDDIYNGFTGCRSRSICEILSPFEVVSLWLGFCPFFLALCRVCWVRATWFVPNMSDCVSWSPIAHHVLLHLILCCPMSSIQSALVYSRGLLSRCRLVLFWMVNYRPISKAMYITKW